jgi:hypothetical protein
MEYHMSDESKAPDTSASPDLVTNLKAEMNRKISATEQQLAEVIRVNKALADQIGALTRPAAAKQPKLADMVYDDPEAFVATVEKRAEEKAWKRMEEVQSSQAAQTQTINQLYNTYPELADSDHPFTQKTLERYGQMSEAEKRDPRALKLAAMETAVDMDIKPKSKRPTDEDSFSIGGNSGGKPRRGSDKLDPNTIEFARKVGLNVDDPKVMESLKKRARRSNWNQYE